MNDISNSLALYLKLYSLLTASSRKFSGGLDGLGFSEFTILFYLNQAPNKKMRRIDLADKLGLTASGVTRQLSSMEKIGLVQKEPNPRDLRVSNVTITESGLRNLHESLERAEELAQQVFSPEKLKKYSDILF